MLKVFGQLVYRKRMSVLVAGVFFAVLAGVYGIGINDSLKAGGLVNLSGEAGRVAGILQNEFGQDKGLLLVMFKSKNKLPVDDPAVKQAVLDTLAKLPELQTTGKITTYYSTNDTRFISSDKLYTLVLVGLTGDTEDANVQAVKKMQPLLTHPELEINLGGRSAVSFDLTNQIKQDLIRAELITFPIVGLLLLIIFRSVVAALLPLLVGAITIFGAFALLRIITNLTEVSTFSISIITMLGLGLAIDYSLFIVSRFREELEQANGNKAQALVKTLGTAGHTVIFSGLTVIVCLLSLLVFPSMFFRSMGLGAAMAVLVAVVTSLTILPALLALMGESVNKGAIRLPFRKRLAPQQPDFWNFTEPGGIWPFVGRLVTRYPVIVILVTLLPLIWAGLPFLRAEFAMFDVRSLPSQQSSRIVNDVLITRFDSGAFTPLQVVIQTDRRALDGENLVKLHNFVEELKNLPDVKKVESLFDLSQTVDKAGYAKFFAEENLRGNPKLNEATRLYANQNDFVVKVYFEAESYSTRAKNLVENIRQLTLPSGFNLLVGGETAYLLDFLSGLANAIPLALTLVAIAMFILLFIMLGSLIVPLKALILNFLSLSVSFGALVWIFQDGNFAGLFNVSTFGTVDAAMPILLFAISFGLSMDYEVFLLSRIKEEYNRTGITSKAIMLGLNKTGSIITGAALTFAIVVSALAFTEVAFVKQAGVGLAIAILVDATVVRMLLLPAAMQIMGNYNWWSPRFLKTRDKRHLKSDHLT